MSAIPTALRAEGWGSVTTRAAIARAAPAITPAAEWWFAKYQLPGWKRSKASARP